MGKAIKRLMKAAGSRPGVKNTETFKAAGLALQGNRLINSLRSRRVGTAAREGMRLGKLVKSARG